MRIRAALMLALWLLAWGEVSVANVISGVAVTLALLLLFPPGNKGGEVRLSAIGLLRLTLHMAIELVKSNLVMAAHIVRRRPDVSPGVLAHHLLRPSEAVVTLMTSLIALSPGTMTVDTDDASETIYVHFFRLDDVEAARAGLARLERLCVNAVAAPTARPAGLNSKEQP